MLMLVVNDLLIIENQENISSNNIVETPNIANLTGNSQNVNAGK